MSDERPIHLQVSDIEAQAGFEWRMSDKRKSVSAFVDDALKERLAEALTETEPLRRKLTDITEALDSVPDDVGDLPDGVDSFLTTIKEARGADKVHGMIALVKALSERLAVKPVVTLVKPLAKKPRARVGATTQMLPGLAANDVKLDEPHVPKLGSVST